uniref:Uncharacterized protein n=1 Tax=Hucho hucho TaxID=62062 RepID=A0A4W5PEH0_9TELE
MDRTSVILKFPIPFWCLGVGNPLNPERTRMLLALRMNVLAKGYSGISLETLHRTIQAFNAFCLSFVPEKGTVGASRDLAPLSHLTLGEDKKTVVTQDVVTQE